AGSAKSVGDGAAAAVVFRVKDLLDELIGMGGDDLIDDLAGAVAAAIIDEDQFITEDRRLHYFDHLLNTIGKQRFLIITGDNHTDIDRFGALGEQVSTPNRLFTP